MTDAAATLVDAGSFRVDRKRALDKLMKFQLPDPRLFALAWVQAAVAGKATRVSIGDGPQGLRLECDGPPWAESDLKDPYSAFFNRPPGWRGARAAAFAVGLLSAFRLEPREIVLKSGRRLLRMRGVTEEESQALDAPVEGTVIDVVGVSRAGLESLAGRCRWCPAELTLMGKRVVREAPRGPSLDFEAGGKSGRVWLDAAERPASSIELVVNGVTVAVHEAALPLVQVGAVLLDDGLKLSLSTTQVVQDARLKRGLALVARQARLLLERSIREAQGCVEEVGRQMLSDGARQWLHRESLLGGWLAGDGADEASARTRRVALIASAVRGACLAGREDLLGYKRGLADRLRGAPIAFDAAGRPLTLAQVEALRRAVGHVPYTGRSKPLPIANGNAVWAPRSGDLRFLSDFFPGQVRPVRAGWSEDRVDTVTVLGDRRLIEADFEYQGLSGRAALSSTGRKGSGRVRWLLRGRSPAATDIDLGCLRVDAWVEREGLAEPPKAGEPLHELCRAALLAAAPSLYRELAARYRPQEETYAQAAIREHLLDLLAADWDRAAQAPRAQRWLEDAALFLEDGSPPAFRSLSALRTRGGGVKPVLFSPSQTPQFVGAARGRPDHVRTLLEEAPWLGGVRRPKPARQEPEGSAPEADPKAELLRLEGLGQAKLEGRLDALRGLLRGLIPASGGALDLDAVNGLQLKGGAPPKDAMAGKVRGGWAVYSGHPLVKLLLELEDREAAHAALASIVFSAMNRESSRVSDLQDIELQSALARAAAQPR